MHLLAEIGLLSMWKRRIRIIASLAGKTNNGLKTRSRETTKEDEIWLNSSSAGRYELLDHSLVLFFNQGNSGGQHKTKGTDPAKWTTGECFVRYRECYFSGRF